MLEGTEAVATREVDCSDISETGAEESVESTTKSSAEVVSFLYGINKLIGKKGL